MILYQNGNIVVRTLEEKDIQTVLKYFGDSNFNCDYETGALRPSPYQFERIMRESLNNPKKTEQVFVLIKDGECIGYMSCYVEYSLLHIGHIVVKKEERNNGYGTLLTVIAQKIANSEERDIRLTCFYNNSYLQKIGFEKNGPHYSYRHKKSINKFPKIFIGIEEYKKMKDEEISEKIKSFKKFLKSDFYKNLF